MAQTNLDQPLSFSLLAENRADTKEQSAARSAQSSASCRRSGCSPAEPYPPHECQESTISTFFPGKGDISTLQKRGHFYFALTH